MRCDMILQLGYNEQTAPEALRYSVHCVYLHVVWRQRNRQRTHATLPSTSSYQHVSALSNASQTRIIPHSAHILFSAAVNTCVWVLLDVYSADDMAAWGLFFTWSESASHVKLPAPDRCLIRSLRPDDAYSAKYVLVKSQWFHYTSAEWSAHRLITVIIIL